MLRFSSSSVRVRGFVARKGEEENLVRGVWGFFFQKENFVREEWGFWGSHKRWGDGGHCREQGTDAGGVGT